MKKRAKITRSKVIYTSIRNRTRTCERVRYTVLINDNTKFAYFSYVIDRVFIVWIPHLCIRIFISSSYFYKTWRRILTRASYILCMGTTLYFQRDTDYSVSVPAISCPITLRTLSSFLIVLRVNSITFDSHNLPVLALAVSKVKYHNLIITSSASLITFPNRLMIGNYLVSWVNPHFISFLRD